MRGAYEHAGLNTQSNDAVLFDITLGIIAFVQTSSVYGARASGRARDPTPGAAGAAPLAGTVTSCPALKLAIQVSMVERMDCIRAPRAALIPAIPWATLAALACVAAFRKETCGCSNARDGLRPPCQGA